MRSLAKSTLLYVSIAIALGLAFGIAPRVSAEGDSGFIRLDAPKSAVAEEGDTGF